jgi:MoxR-like ATPase
MENEIQFQNRLDLGELSETVSKLEKEIGKVIVGQKDLIKQMLIALLADGHLLIEGVPGIAKTLAVKLLAKTIDAKYSRIQFTPDLMPSDVTGTNVFNLSKGEFIFNAGPVFGNIILIDEINRAPAKTQAALFEVMEERQVTLEGKTHVMERPFNVFATQNPIEHEGTYRLPEAQLDRFLFKISVGYPTLDEEVEILLRAQERKSKPEIDEISPIVSGSKIIEFQKLIKEIIIEESLRKYIAQLVHKTRSHNAIYLGASPRAGIFIMNAARANAALEGRDFTTPDDIRYVFLPVLNHRIQLTPEKELEGQTVKNVVNNIIQSVEVPR